MKQTPLLLFSLLFSLPTRALATPNALTTYETGGKRALIALTTPPAPTTAPTVGAVRSRLSRYDGSNTLLKSVQLNTEAHAVCTNGSQIVVGTTSGTLLLFSMELKELRRVHTSTPILSLLCAQHTLYVGGKSIKVALYALPSLVFKKVAFEHSSWVSTLLHHPTQGVLSVSWSHRARRWGGGPPLRFKFFSGPVDAAVSTSHNILGILTDRNKVRFYSTVTGARLNYAKAQGGLCVATWGKLFLVGLANGYALRFVLKGTRFRKAGALPLLKRSPIQAMAPLSDNVWALFSRGKLFFKKVQ